MCSREVMRLIVYRNKQGKNQMEDELFNLSQFTIEREIQNAVSETCNIGAFAEMKFCCAAITNGYEVFLPMSHSTKTDIVILKQGSSPIRVQVKKATYQKREKTTHLESWKFMIGSGRPSCANNPQDYGLRYRKYEDDDFDILAAYILEKDIFAFYNLSDIRGASCMRWDQSKRIDNWDIFNQYSK